MTPRQLRLLRAASASTVATLLAAVSHTLGGGMAPHPLLVIALSAFLTPLAAVLIGPKQRRVRVATTVLVAQAVFHLAFLLLGTPRDTGFGVGVGHSHHLDLSALGPIAPSVAPDAAMLAAHIVAAALTTLLVWHGERLLRGVARWVHAALRRALPVAPAEHKRPPALHSTLRRISDTGISVVVLRRGPPVLSRG